MLDCLNPVVLPKLGFQVPCGKCILCRTNQKKDWSLRLLLEAKEYGFNTCFVSVTYADEHLTEELVYSDVQKYLKRLRKAVAPRKFRYFVVGEYGGLRHRPHFHLVFFGLSYKDKDVIESSWSKGFITLGSFNSARARYCSGYVQKKLQFSIMSNILKQYNLSDLSITERINAVMNSPFLLNAFEERHLGLDALYIQPFSHCSNRPGIGFCWYQKHKEDLLDKRYIVLGNFKYRIPKYFKRMLYVDFPDLRDEILSDLSLFDEENYVKYLEKHPYSDYNSFLDYSYSCLNQKALEKKKKNELYAAKQNSKGDNYYVI